MAPLSVIIGIGGVAQWQSAEVTNKVERFGGWRFKSSPHHFKFTLLVVDKN